MGSDHELRIGGPRIAVEVSYHVYNVFAYPMEEVVFKVLLYLSLHDSSRTLQLDLIEGSFKHHGKEGNFLMVTLEDFIEVLHENIK